MTNNGGVDFKYKLRYNVSALVSKLYLYNNCI